MKIYLHSLAILICLVYSRNTSAQIGAVELKDENAVLLSTHPSVSAAIFAIPTAITHTYIIELTSIYDGTAETYPITFGLNTGSSASNLIILRPASGVTSVSIAATQSASSVIILNDADYTVIDGRAGGQGSTPALTINNMGTTSNSNTIQLINGATHNIIRYCQIENGTTTLSGRGISFSTSGSNASGNSDNRVEYCKLNSGRYKIATNGTAANPNTRLEIVGCEMLDIIFVGFWYQSGTGKVTIDSCTIHSVNPVGGGPYGILFDGMADSVIITRNRIYNLDNGTNTSAVKGISIRSVNATIPSYSFFYNNFIGLSASNPNSTSVEGIEYLGGNTTTTKFLFNTIRIGGAFTATGVSGNVLSAGLSKDASNSANSFDIRNNIIVNTRSGGTSGVQHLAISLIDSSRLLLFDYNTYNSVGGQIARLGTSVFTDMSTYRTALGGNREPHSNDSLVEFVGPSDLHLSGTSLGNNALGGFNILDITIDADNDLRSSIPYRGADEAFPPLGIVGVPEIENDNSFIVYPNPAMDRFSISLSENFGTEFTIRILDILGHECFSSAIHSQGKTKFEFSAKEMNLKSGIYLVHIHSEKLMMNKRIIIEN